MWYLFAGFFLFEVATILPFWLPRKFSKRLRQMLQSSTLFYFESFLGLIVMIKVILAVIKYIKMIPNWRDDQHSDTKEMSKLQLPVNGILMFLLVVLRRCMMLRPLLTLVEALKEVRLHDALLCESLICENNQLKKALEDAERKTEMNDEYVRDQKVYIEAFKEKSKKLSEQSKGLERAKKDLAASEEQFAGLKQAYDKLLEEHAKAQVIEEEEGKTETDLSKKQSKELEKAKKDLAAFREQAAGLTREYDRLLEENTKLQAKVKFYEGETREGKKRK